MDNFDQLESNIANAPLDGSQLVSEIKNVNQTSKLNQKTNGVGIKSKSDLADLLAGIKGAQ